MAIARGNSSHERTPAHRPRSLMERHPSLPVALPLEHIERICCNASARLDCNLQNRGLQLELRQINSLHLTVRRRVRITNEEVIARCDKEGKLTLYIGNFCFTPYTQLGAVAFYEWLVHAGKMTMKGKPYCHPVACTFHKYPRPRGT